MKKFSSVLLLIAAIFMSVPADAQNELPADWSGNLFNITTPAKSYILDTLTNADTTTYTFSLSGAKQVMQIMVPVDSISGTVAGDIKLYGALTVNSVDRWLLIDSDTLVNADGLDYWYDIGASKYTKYKLVCRTSGTQKCTVVPGGIWRALYKK